MYERPSAFAGWFFLTWSHDPNVNRLLAASCISAGVYQETVRPDVTLRYTKARSCQPDALRSVKLSGGLFVFDSTAAWIQL